MRTQYEQSDIEVFNAGMDWYITKHSLINYVTNLRDAVPDLIVAMHAVNDLYRSFFPPDFTIGSYHRLWFHLRPGNFWGQASGVCTTSFVQDLLAFPHFRHVFADSAQGTRPGTGALPFTGGFSAQSATSNPLFES